MQRPPLLMLVILLTAFNAERALGASSWYTPFAVALVVIAFAALLVRNDRDDRA